MTEDRYRAGTDILLAGTIAVMMAVPIQANSSWYWISKTRPHDLLPVVIVFTIAIEAAAVLLPLQRRSVWKVLFFVTLGNLLSFAAPYLWNYLIYTKAGFPFRKYLTNWPSYIVGTVYLIATLAIELPVVWIALRKDAAKQGRLALMIAAANSVTMGLTALAERLLCRGTW